MKRYAQQMILALAFLTAGAGTVFAETIVIKGSTTVLPIAQAACLRGAVCMTMIAANDQERPILASTPIKRIWCQS